MVKGDDTPTWVHALLNIQSSFGKMIHSLLHELAQGASRLCDMPAHQSRFLSRNMMVVIPRLLI